MDAVESAFDSNGEDVSKKMAEYAWAVLNGRPHFHVMLAIDISPQCDCYGQNDVPITPDIGMFASFDPVAMDVAAAEIVIQAPVIPGSILDGCSRRGRDHFDRVSEASNWHIQIDHAVKMGLGNKEYELVRV